MKLLEAFKKQLDALLPLPLNTAPAVTRAQGGACIARSTVPTRRIYSHGLEKIYALETVNPSTVKLFDNSAKATPVPSEKPLTPPPHLTSRSLPRQGEFDFGPLWRRWISPCVLKEPLRVLELSKQAESSLTSQGYLAIGDLLAADGNGLVAINSLGQGHRDDLACKLQSYLADRCPLRSHTVDWGAWLRSLVVPLSPKMARAFLEHCGVGDVFSLTIALQAEMRRLSTEERQRLVGEASTRLRENLTPLRERLNEVIAALVLPWVRERGGIASTDELSERLEQVSADPHRYSRSWRLMAELLSDNPFASTLFQVAPGVYCADAASAANYTAAVQLAESYFYRPDLCYAVDDLAIWIVRERAKRWEGSSPAMIAKILCYSPQWTARKGYDGRLFLRETPFT